jgi:hypothetical protein
MLAQCRAQLAIGVARPHSDGGIPMHRGGATYRNLSRAFAARGCRPAGMPRQSGSARAFDLREHLRGQTGTGLCTLSAGVHSQAAAVGGHNASRPSTGRPEAHGINIRRLFRLIHAEP